MNKKTGAAPATPSQTLTSRDNRHDRHNCQGETEEPLFFTLPNDQIGDVNTPGAITAASVRPLPLEIGHSDHKCKQVWRDETHAVYKHFGCRGQFIDWEAIKIKKAKPAVIFGKSYPAREVYPGNEDFGTYALSVGAQYDLEYAIEKAKTLKCRRETPAVAAMAYLETNLEQDGDVLEQEQTQTETSNTNTN
jgi:hypothetical protein